MKARVPKNQRESGEVSGEEGEGDYYDEDSDDDDDDYEKCGPRKHSTGRSISGTCAMLGTHLNFLAVQRHR